MTVLPSTPAFAAGFPAHVMAPYVDIGFSSANAALSGSTLSTIANDYGDKYFTLAFVNGSGCQWSMYNASTYQSEVNNLRTMGGDAIISFGGWTADSGSTDLGNACSSASAAATQIENVVTYFNATRLDFDIESYALSNHTDVDRTNAALALVRSWASSNGRSLAISYTIPVLPSGLTSDGQFVLTNGQSHGFKPDVVNVMAMDYGTSGTEMGSAAEQALDATAGQVASVYGLSSSSAYAMMGLTVMIGQNDSAGEIFTLSDASTVESYAASKNIALLSFWSEGRDNGNCAGQTTASSTCSGISQSTGQFTTAFNSFTGGSSGGSGGTGGGGTAGASGPIRSGLAGKCMDVNGANSANGTAVQLYDCNGTNAQNWTAYSDGTLRALGKCLDATGNGTANGTKLEIWDCTGGANQVWSTHNGGYQNPTSGRCIDDPSSSTNNFTQLQLWDCNGTNAQIWSTPGGTASGGSGGGGTITGSTITGPGGKCIDVSGDDTGGNGAAVQLWDCQSGAVDQHWTYTGNTLQTLGRCMDVTSGGTANGTKVQLYDCNGTGSQQWTRGANGSLVNPQSGRCLDDPSGSTTNGARLQIWDCNGSGAQDWTSALFASSGGGGGTSAQPWAPNVAYTAGEQVTYNGALYTCLQSHTSQVGWEPPNAPSLWQAD